MTRRTTAPKYPGEMTKAERRAKAKETVLLILSAAAITTAIVIITMLFI